VVNSRDVPEQIQGRNPHFVNHDDELREAVDAIRACVGNHVVVVVGSPGTGKTAAAVELSFRVADDYPDGRLMARLGPGAEQTGAESEVLRDFLGALHVDPRDIPDRLDARRALFQSMTSGRRMQVLLDGAISAGQVRTLLPGDGNSLIVVTEGRPLSTLAADTSVTFIELSPLEPEAARELLSRLVGADRLLAEPDQVDEVIELCGRLPIALCVVGAMISRSRVRTFATMVERLRDERRRLAALSRDADLSVSAPFTAAYRQLSDSAQLCYRTFGLRPRTGEISAEAVSAALDLPDYEVVEAMAELVDARLSEEQGTPDRLVVRELVRLHAEQIDTRPDDERQAESLRLVGFYHQRAVDADELIAPLRPWRRALWPDLRPHDSARDATAARAWLRMERANLRAAVELAHDNGQDELVVQWCVLLWPFYEKEKFFEDLVATHELGVASADRLGRVDAASLVHTQLGFAHYWRRDLAAASRSFGIAVELARTADSTELEATACEGLGLTEHAAGHDQRARTLLRRNLELAIATGDQRRIALARLHLAKPEAPETALVLLEDAASAFAALPGDELENQAKVLTWRGRKLTELARWDEADVALRWALDAMSTRRRRFDEADVLVALGDLAARTGDADAARQHFSEALTCYEDLGFTTLAEAVRRRITDLPG
jgi:tetratricopeptide (TPR) repeat protein